MPKARGTGADPGRIDPAAASPEGEFLRAISNPVRLAMLQFLAVQGTATATLCGAVAGVSATSASYHLRLLASHGIVEEVPSGDRRERPWRLLTTPSVTIPTGGELARSSAIAKFLSAAESREQAVASEFELGARDFPAEWQNDIRIQNILRLSPDEFRQLRRELNDILRPYTALALERAPEAAEHRFVYVSIRVVPWVRAEFARQQARVSAQQGGDASAPNAGKAIRRAQRAPLRRSGSSR